MPAWIHDRATSLKKDMEKTYTPEKAKQVAYATATQMAHRLGKSPKTFISKVTGKKERFGTRVGKVEAKEKFDKPLKEYRKTAASREDYAFPEKEYELGDKEFDQWAKKKALIGAARGALPISALTGMLGLRIGLSRSGTLRRGLAGAATGATLGQLGGMGLIYPKAKRKQELNRRIAAMERRGYDIYRDPEGKVLDVKVRKNKTSSDNFLNGFLEEIMDILGY